MAVSEERLDHIYWVISDHWRTHYRAPTLREIINIAKIGDSTSYASKALEELEQDGRIEMTGESGEARRATPYWVVRMLRGGPDG